MLRLCGRPQIVIQRCMGSHEALKLLGLKEGSSKKEIRDAYFQHAKIYHPDNQVWYNS